MMLYVCLLLTAIATTAKLMGYVSVDWFVVFLPLIGWVSLLVFSVVLYSIGKYLEE